MTQEKSVYPLVYVILLNWNGWRDTLECLRSLNELEYPDHRLLVVDNGSDDDSVPRIRTAYPNIELVETGENLGFAGGNNVGIRWALGKGADYVWLLNNDTTVDPHALCAMVRTAEADKKIGAVGSVLYDMDRPGVVQAWGGGKVSMWLGVTRYHKSGVPAKLLHYITGASLMVKSEALEEVGLLEDRFFMYWEDADFGARLQRAGWSLTVAGDSRVWHKEFASTEGNVVRDAYFNSSAVVFFEKHARVSLIPIVVGVGGRILKRLCRGDFKGARAVLRSAFGKPKSVRVWGRVR